MIYPYQLFHSRTFDIQIIQPKAVVKSGKKVAPAPYAAGAKPATAVKKNPLFEKTPKNFGIGSSISLISLADFDH